MKKTYLLLAACSFSVFGMAQDVSFVYETLNSSYQASSTCAVDMNGDFLDDIVTVQTDQMTIYHQTENGFESEIYALPNLQTGPGWSIAAGDYNEDGKNDLVFGGGSNVSFIKSNGFSYVEVPFGEYIFSQRTNFIDIDNDGNLDAFVCHDVDQSHPYRNDGAGNLVLDIPFFSTLDVGGNYASIWTDYNNDGAMDMYLAKCRGGAPDGDPQRINLLYKNNGDGTFTESGAEANMNDGSQSWSTAFADFDNDGDMDAFISNISDTNKFMLNNGDGTFTDIIDAAGMDPYDTGSWEVQAADFNNDGLVDLLAQMNHQLFLNNGDMTFTGYNMATGEGAIGDLNNDGFLDVASVAGVHFNQGNANNWIKITTKGLVSNRNGIGARIELYGAWGKQIREIRSGEGFSHMNTLNTHFGLGTATEIDQVVIKWPSGIVDIIENPAVNESIHVEEGATLAVNDYIASNISLFPNPSENFLNIGSAENYSFKSATVFDLSGKQVANFTEVREQMDISSISSGTYLLLLEDISGKYHKQKFVKK